MNFEFFLAKRLLRQNGSTFSRPIVRIATVSIALSIAVMIISVGVLGGFKNQIKQKITGFTSHIHILPYSLNMTSSSDAFTLSEQELGSLYAHPNTQSIEPYILQGGAIKTKSSFQGVLLKGVEKNYDTTFFASNLIEGRLPDYSDPKASSEVLISKTIADKMQLELSDKMRVYFFIDSQYRVRPFKVVGIYQSGLGDYDEKFILASASVFQRLNNWDSNSYGGYELRLKDFSKLQSSASELYATLSQDKTLATIDEIEPGLFAWLSLLDSNVILIIVVMTLVTITATCSTLLIMVFEQTSYIGLLKSMGAQTRSIIKVYLYKASYIVGRAVLYGNAIALLVGIVQDKFKIIKLDPGSYYLDSVPIELNAVAVITVNVAVVAVSLASLLIPARSIGKISPATTIRKS